MISFRENWNRSRTQLNIAQFEVSELTTFNRKQKAEKEEKAALQGIHVFFLARFKTTRLNEFS